MKMSLAALLYLIAMVLAFVAVFVTPPRHSLLAAALGFVSAGLLCQVTGLGA